MFKLIYKLLLLLVIVSPAIILIAHGNANGGILSHAEDVADGEDDEGQVESEDAEGMPLTATTTDEEEDYDDDSKPVKASSDADTHFLFVKPTTTDLPAAAVVDILVGFTNKGSKDMIIDTLDASLRYPMDFSFTIQNFSIYHCDRLVKPSEQVTLDYSFVPSEAFGSRPFGLVVSLNYHDSDGTPYFEAVFNETVNIIEVEDGLDGEVIFLYIFMAACAVLLVIVGQQLLATYGRKKSSKKAKRVEVGTANPNDVDFDWLPKETLDEIRRTSPKVSPRQRRSKRNTGSDE